MPEFLAPIVVRLFKLALYGLFVAIPAVITREPVARRIRAWTRPRAGVAYAGLGALIIVCLYLAVTLRHDPASAGLWWFFGAGYLGETLVFVGYVRSEHLPGFVRARRRTARERAERAD